LIGINSRTGILERILLFLEMRTKRDSRKRRSKWNESNFLLQRLSPQSENVFSKWKEKTITSSVRFLCPSYVLLSLYVLERRPLTTYYTYTYTYMISFREEKRWIWCLVEIKFPSFTLHRNLLLSKGSLSNLFFVLKGWQVLKMDFVSTPMFFLCACPLFWT